MTIQLGDITLEELVALEAKSTRSPWITDQGGDRSLVYTVTDPIADCWSNMHETDSRLIAALRNAFPTIVAKLEAAERLRNAVFVHQDWCRDVGVSSIGDDKLHSALADFDKGE